MSGGYRSYLRVRLRGCSADDQCRIFDVFAARLRRDCSMSGDDVLGAATLCSASYPLGSWQIPQLLSASPLTRSELLRAMLRAAHCDPAVLHLRRWPATFESESLTAVVRGLTPRDARSVARDVLYAIHERLLRDGRDRLRERADSDLSTAVAHASCRCAAAAAWVITTTIPTIDDETLRAAGRRDQHNDLLREKLSARLLAGIRSYPP